MKISGNGNATIYFKKHGVTDAQMMSEKKYKTKAAQEYRKHIHKLLHEDSHGHLHAASADSADSAPVAAASGLDHMMQSLLPKTEDGFGESVPVVPAVAPAAPVTVFSSVPLQARGTLDVTTAATEGESLPSTGQSEGLTQQQLMKQMLGKKGKAKGLKGGARRLDQGGADVKLESFEAVERSALQRSQEEADRRLAVKLQAVELEEGPGPGKVSAALQAEDSSKSLYRGTAAPAPSSAYRPASSSGGGESRLARDKYSSQKGISSDQFFGRDDEDAERARDRLQQFSGSTSISSDMISGGAWSGGTGAGLGSGAALNKLSESVAGFFDDIQKRIG